MIRAQMDVRVAYVAVLSHGARGKDSSQSPATPLLANKENAQRTTWLRTHADKITTTIGWLTVA